VDEFCRDENDIRHVPRSLPRGRTDAGEWMSFVATKTIFDMCRDHYRAAELMRESG
jgi:hypothetical protein